MTDIPSVGEWVARAAPGTRLEDVSVEAAQAIEHAIRNHIQTVWALEAGLEQKVRDILARHPARPARVVGGALHGHRLPHPL